MKSPFLSPKCQLTHYYLKVQKYSFFTPNLISPFRLAPRPTPTIPQRFNEIKTTFCFALQWDGRNQWCPMLGCSFVHALQQQILSNINICQSRIMHLKFLRCQQMFRCFSVKNMGCKPTSCLLFCEVVYGTGISNHWLLLCVQFWLCIIEIALVLPPPSSEITTWRVSAYWLS